MDETPEKNSQKFPKRPEAVTLKDVAAVAGVSEVTISRTLRNKGYISAATRMRVMAAVEKVGYLPNRIAGTLASTAASNLVGVIIPSLSNIVFPEVLQGIHSACRHAGLQPVVGVTEYDPRVEESLVSSLLAWQPTALIIAGFEHTATTQRLLLNSKVRVAELMDIESRPVDIAVGLSHRMVGHDSVRHLIGRGYRRFGYVGHDLDADRRARQRHDGIRDALRNAGLALQGQSLFNGPSSVAAGRAMLEQMLSRTSDVDVVLFSNDDMAIGGVFHCMANDIALKSQLGIFGFNGLEMGQSLPVPLSTIRSNRFLMGKLAVEKLLEQPDRVPHPVILDTGYELLEGGTA